MHAPHQFFWSVDFHILFKKAFHTACFVSVQSACWVKRTVSFNAVEPLTKERPMRTHHFKRF